MPYEPIFKQSIKLIRYEVTRGGYLKLLFAPYDFASLHLQTSTPSIQAKPNSPVFTYRVKTVISSYILIVSISIIILKCLIWFHQLFRHTFFNFSICNQNCNLFMYNLYGCLYWHLRSLGIYFVNSQLVLLVIKSYLRQAGVRGLQGQADQLGELKTRHLFIEKLRRCSTNLGSGNTKAVQRHPYITMNSIKRTSRSQTFSSS